MYVVGCCLLSVCLVLLRAGVVRCCSSLLVVVVCRCGLQCAVSCVRLLLSCYIWFRCVSCLYAGTGRCYVVLCGVRFFVCLIDVGCSWRMLMFVVCCVLLIVA